MADGRFISKSISESRQLSSESVSIQAALLFSWSISHLDVEGRLVGNPVLVKAKVCPLRDDIPVSRVPAILAELVAAGLVIWYEVEGKQCLFFPGFQRQQKGLRKRREAKSKLPAPNAPGAVLVTASDPSQLTLSVHPTPLQLRSGPAPAIAGPTPATSGSTKKSDRQRPAEVEVEVEVEGEVEGEAEATRQRLKYALACTMACNEGLHANPAIGDRCNELYASSQTAPLEWYADGIDVAVAAAAVRAAAIAYKPKPRNPQPRDLRYFDGAVRDAWERTNQRVHTSGKSPALKDPAYGGNAFHEVKI
jgi:hypothetical protein